MHDEVLTLGQVRLLPLIRRFSKDFCLVGGTAVALHIGHRRSIDFDLFAEKSFDNVQIRKKIIQSVKIERVFINEKDEYTIIAGGVKITFLRYDFKIDFKEKFKAIIRLPDLLTLAAMKAYALGQRAKWKDYIDLYFIMKKYRGIVSIIKKAKEIFSSEFNEKMFRAQLIYFRDIDYSESVIYMKGFEVKDEIIKKALVDFSLNGIK